MSVHDRVPFERQGTAQIYRTEHQTSKELHPGYQPRRSHSSSPAPPLQRVASNLSTLTEDEGTPYPVEPDANANTRAPVKWRELPRKDQLIILTLIRLSEPITQTSLQAYMFYMLKSFDENQTSAAIAGQAGWLAGGFTAAQCLTAVLWGRMADSFIGRKPVLMIGLVGTMISALGFGFSRNFHTALLFRFLGGALNGDVGVMRTMVSEIVKEKKYQPKAFLLMPVAFNVGVLVGPILGGWLQNPVSRYPGVFGRNSVFGGPDGVVWMAEYPYALPNIIMAMFLMSSFLLGILGLEETHAEARSRRDYGLETGRWIARKVCSCVSNRPSDYTKVEQADGDDIEMVPADVQLTKPPQAPLTKSKLPWRRIFTRNVSLTFVTHGLLALHIGGFNNLWFVFLSTPRFDPADPQPPSHTEQRLPFSFTGGLGLPPPTIGFAVGIIGVLGLTLQFGVYSRVTQKIGLLAAYRHAVLLFPLVYLFAPFLSLVPTNSRPPAASDGPWMWMTISGLLFLQTVGRTFSLPIAQILCNNCTPHPSVLGTVHGIAQTVSSGMRTLGPVLFSWIYGVGLSKGTVGLAWWVLAAQATLVFLVSGFIYEGSGHEIRLPGD